MVLAWEALDRLIPDVFIGAVPLVNVTVSLLCSHIYQSIDTMGYAFTFPLVRWLRLRPIVRLQPNVRAAATPIGAYVHYPTISTDMLKRVKDRQAGVTNQASVSNSSFRTWVKLL